MKTSTSLYILSISLLLIGCSTTKDKYVTLEELQDNFAEQARIRNEEIYSWDKKIEEFYSRADIELTSGVSYADSLISTDSTMSSRKIAELNTIVGETYYDNGHGELALERFYVSQSLIRDNPRNKANKAGCHAMKGEYEIAITLLQEAAAINYDFNWLLGNLYEMMGNKELAIEHYNFLYQKNSDFYSNCNDRIQEISQNSELYTELQFQNRRRRLLIITEGVDENSKELQIGKMQLEIRD